MTFKIYSKKIFTLFFLALVLSFAKTEQEESSYGKTSISKQKSVSLQLDSKSRNWSMNNQYIVDNDRNEERLCLLNSPTNSLQFYTLGGNKVHEIKFKNEGPNSTGIVSGFLYVNNDSIFILNNLQNRIYLSNSRGEVKKTYQLPAFSKNKYFLHPWSEDGTEIFLHKGHLFIPGIPWISYDKNPKDYYNKGLIGIDLDLATSSSRFHIPYPNKEWLIDKPFNSQSISPKCIANPTTGHLIYSFGVDSYVYEYSTEGKLLKKHFFGTKNKEEVPKPMANRNGFNDPIEEALNYTNNLCYERLFFDKFRNLYYRIVKHSIPESNEYTRKDFNLGKRPWFKYSLIIADTNFKILDEVPLKDGIGSGALIVTKEGVLIQKENEDENLMEFDSFIFTHPLHTLPTQ